MTFHLQRVFELFSGANDFELISKVIFCTTDWNKMHIKSIVLEGFKSYAQRTEVNGFDPLFNAITGLNGSGKSNILDGICFLLGISNLSQASFWI